MKIYIKILLMKNNYIYKMMNLKFNRNVIKNIIQKLNYALKIQINYNFLL